MAKRDTSRRESSRHTDRQPHSEAGRQGPLQGDGDNVGRSLEADRRTKAKISVKSGHGEQGDRKRSG